MVDVFVHLGRNSYVDINDVGHFHPFFFCCMGKVGKGLIDSNQVFGSLATLSWSLLALSEVGLIFNKIGLKGRPGFLIYFSPHLKNSGYWPVSATILYAMRTSWVSVTGSPAAAAKFAHSLSISTRFLIGYYTLCGDGRLLLLATLSVAEIQAYIEYM